MRGRSVLALAVTGLWILACAGEEAEEGTEEGTEEAPADLEPGAIHEEYPTAAIEAEPGQFVLAPSRDSLERAVAEDGGTFIYYGGELVEAGEVESKVKSLAGTEFTIPNTLIIPVDASYEAKPGDVLLGHWESGSGMRRAFVTGGEPNAPTVRYLDRAYDKEHEGEQEEDTFEAGRYEPLTAAWQVGTTVACGQGTDRDHGILVHDAGDRVLVSGFASKLEAKDRSDCVSLPPRQRFAEGDNVWVPVVGSYNEGTVTAVDKDAGRIWVKYEWGGAEKEEAFPIVDVTKGFEGLDEGEEADAPEGEEPEAAEQGGDPQPRRGGRRPSPEERQERRVQRPR